MYNIFNQACGLEHKRQWNMQQNVQRPYNDQMRKVAECVQKLDDFMKSTKEVSPEYQNVAFGLCCMKLGEYMSKN